LKIDTWFPVQCDRCAWRLSQSFELPGDIFARNSRSYYQNQSATDVTFFIYLFACIELSHNEAGSTTLKSNFLCDIRHMTKEGKYRRITSGWRKARSRDVNTSFPSGRNALRGNLNEQSKTQKHFDTFSIICRVMWLQNLCYKQTAGVEMADNSLTNCVVIDLLVSFTENKKESILVS